MKQNPALPKSISKLNAGPLFNLANSNVANISAEERSGQRVAGDLADLQAHQALQEDHALPGTHPPAEVPPGDLRVSVISNLEFTQQETDTVSTSFNPKLFVDNSSLLSLLSG